MCSLMGILGKSVGSGYWINETSNWRLNMALDYQKSRIEGVYRPDTLSLGFSDSLPLAVSSYYNIRIGD